MRIRSKLLCFLLVMVVTPLCVLGVYAWRQTGELGRELSERAAMAMEANAGKELRQTRDPIPLGQVEQPFTHWPPPALPAARLAGRWLLQGIGYG